MIALRLVKTSLVLSLLSMGLMAGCQSNKPSPTATHDLPAVEQTAPKAPVVEAPPSTPSVPDVAPGAPASEPQPVDVTLNPDKSVKHAKAKPGAKVEKSEKASAKAASGKRSGKDWYLVVASDKTHAKYLDEYAAYLNKKGVSVTVEKRGDHYTVLSTEGFASATATDAKALKSKILKLGKEFSPKKPVWQDAYFLPPHGHKAASAKSATKPAAKK